LFLNKGLWFQNKPVANSEREYATG